MHLSPRMYCLTCLLLFISVTVSWGQVDSLAFTDEQGLPLQGVFVFDLDGQHAEVSNKQGMVSLKKFDQKASLEAQFLGYETLIIDPQKLENATIALRPLPFFFDEFVIRANDDSNWSWQ